MSRREQPEPNANDALDLAESRMKESYDERSDLAAHRYEDELRRDWDRRSQ